MSLSTQPGFITSSQGTNPPQGTRFIFCNGVETSLRDAERVSNRISELINKHRVDLFYTPSQLRRDGTNPYSDLNTSAVDELTKGLLDLVSYKFGDANEVKEDQPDPCIVLFAHSHGAFLCKKALQRIRETNELAIGYFEFYGFGGAAVVPRSLGKQDCVINFVNLGDFTMRGGNQFLDSDEAYRTVYSDGIDIYRCKNELGTDDLDRVVESCALSGLQNNNLELAQRVKQYIQGEALDPFTAQDIERYKELFERYRHAARDYSIHFLEPAQLGHIEWTPEPIGESLFGAISRLVRDAFWNVAAAIYIHSYYHHAMDTGYDRGLTFSCDAILGRLNPT